MIVLDTHVLLWLAGEPAKLSKDARQAIEQGYQHGGVGISAITLWEVAWLVTHRRIHVSGTPGDFVEALASRVSVRPITPKIAVLANLFPAAYSADPCDRLIGATALAEHAALVTKDRSLRASHDIQTIW